MAVSIPVKKTFTPSITRPGGPTHFSPAREGREPVRSIAEEAPAGRHADAAVDNPEVPPLPLGDRGGIQPVAQSIFRLPIAGTTARQVTPVPRCRLLPIFRRP
jgi:hypothetical protein